MNEDAPAAVESGLYERTCSWEVNEEIFVFGVLNCDGEPVVLWFEGVFCTDRQDVCDAELLAYVLGEGCCKISDVQRTVYDGVD